MDDIDLLIAGVAIDNDMTLVTNNENHFSRIPKIENWSKRTGGKYSASSIQKIIVRAACNAGISREVTPHGFTMQRNPIQKAIEFNKKIPAIRYTLGRIGYFRYANIQTKLIGLD
ncbi:MAG: hypothetical protein MI975_09640, partial [Cytophagales bacterium]|nr:hypothetical protein [Cytophagales bacterium]